MNRELTYYAFIAAGLRNRPGRNIAAAFCFAFIAANIFSSQFLLAGAAAGLERGVTRMGADQLVVPIEYMATFRSVGTNDTIAIVRVDPTTYRVKADILDRLKEVPGIASISPQLYVSTLDLPDLSPSPVEIYGFDPVTDFAIQPWLREPLDTPLSPGDVIVGHEIAVDLSSTIGIRGNRYTVAGRLDQVQSAVDRTVFMGLEDAYRLAAADGVVPSSSPPITHGDINAVLVRDSPGENPEVVGTRISRAFSSTFFAFGNIGVIGRHFALDPVARDVQNLPGLLAVTSAVVVVAAFPLIALIAAMVAHERRREIGILKAMGATRGVVFLLVIAESLMVSAAGGLTGICASLVAFFLMNMQGLLSSALQVSFRMPSPAGISLMAGMALFLVIAVGSAAALWPAYQSSAMNPYDAIRNDGL